MITSEYDEDDDAGRPLRPVNDLAGLAVLDVDGSDAGQVFGALTEADTGLIRYLDLAVARSDRHVLVPIGHTRVEEGPTGRRIRLRAVTRGELQEIPPFDPQGDEMDDEFHQAVLAAFGRFLYGQRYYAHPAYDHQGLYAGSHPIVRDEPEDVPAEEGAELRPLRDLPAYHVAPGEPDFRGWELLDRNGAAAGTVEDLLVDLQEVSVRYALLKPARAAHTVLVPVGFLETDTAAEKVRLPALDSGELALLPPHSGDSVTRDDEEQARRALADILSGPRRFARPDFARRE